MSDSIENIIAQDRQQAALDEQRRQQAIDEARPIARVREALEQLRTYGGPVDGSSETAVADWTARLVALRDALEEAGQLQLLDRLPANGNARQLLRTLLRQGRDNLAGHITEALTSVAPLGELARELLHELNCQLPQDLQGRLAEWNGPARGPDEDAKRRGPRSSAPLSQDQAVLAFMVFWEHQLRTGASRHGQPEHYQLPEQGETENDRAALKLLRACCSDYFRAEHTVLAFLNDRPERQIRIEKSMYAILARAREAAARAALFDGSPPAGEDTPTTGQAKVVKAPEEGLQAVPPTEARPLTAAVETEPEMTVEQPAVPLNNLMSAADIARYLGQPVKRVERFLYRYREKRPGCAEELPNPQRREARYLFRTADVWPALLEKLSEWKRLTDD